MLFRIQMKCLFLCVSLLSILFKCPSVISFMILLQHAPVGNHCACGLATEKSNRSCSFLKKLISCLCLYLWKTELQDSGQQWVIALQDYTAIGDDDLSLQKDQEYLLINRSHSDWWAVQDDKG